MWACLATVYIVWGSTYLAIRLTVETVPPLLGMGARFLTAGALLYVWLRLKRGRRGVASSMRENLSCALVGAALLLGGNGVVAIAEQHAASSLAALILGSIPLWIVILRALTGEKVPRGTLAGVMGGFAGVALLVVPRGAEGGTEALGVLLLVLASLSWSLGSFFSGRVALPADPFTSTALQMLWGGAFMTMAGMARGELDELVLSDISATSFWALVYLVLIGSVAAFTAFTWLLKNAPISKVATYAYVNPLVAVLLGWSLAAEDITGVMLLAALVIVSSVAFTVSHETPAPPPSEPLQAPRPEWAADRV